jgi:hypothetical protein
MARDPDVELGPREYHLLKRDGRPVPFHETFAPKPVEKSRALAWPGLVGIWVGVSVVIACIVVVPGLGYLLALLGLTGALGLLLLAYALRS